VKVNTMPNGIGSKNITLYYNANENVPSLTASEIKLLLKDLKELFEQVRFNESDYSSFMKSHSELEKVMDKW
jgi:hypothetical protein